MGGLSLLSEMQNHELSRLPVLSSSMYNLDVEGLHLHAAIWRGSRANRRPCAVSVKSSHQALTLIGLRPELHPWLALLHDLHIVLSDIVRYCHEKSV